MHSSICLYVHLWVYLAVVVVAIIWLVATGNMARHQTVTALHLLTIQLTFSNNFMISPSVAVPGRFFFGHVTTTTAHLITNCKS